MTSSSAIKSLFFSIMNSEKIGQSHSGILTCDIEDLLEVLLTVLDFIIKIMDLIERVLLDHVLTALEQRCLELDYILLYQLFEIVEVIVVGAAVHGKSFRGMVIGELALLFHDIRLA